MVSLIEITNAMVDTLRKIPELVAELEGGTAAVLPYIDENPIKNSFSKAIYQMPAGSLLVVWQSTSLESVTETMYGWIHRHLIAVRARRGASALTALDMLMDGVPVPGDGLRWRYCPILAGCLPTEVTEIARLTDEEGIDYYVVSTTTQETGDT
jgi:hypothetical protein